MFGGFVGAWHRYARRSVLRPYDFGVGSTSSIKTFPPPGLGARKKLIRVPSAPARVAG
jgi:hypothetical protein